MFFTPLQKRARDSTPANAFKDVHAPYFGCVRVNWPVCRHPDWLPGLAGDHVHATRWIWRVRWPRRAGIVQIGVEIARLLRGLPKQGPGWRKHTAYRQHGPRELPLALRLGGGLFRTRVGDFVIGDPFTHDEVHEGLGAWILEMVPGRLAGREADVGAAFQLVLFRAEVKHCRASQGIEVLFFVRVPMTRLRVRAGRQFHQADADLCLTSHIAECSTANLAIRSRVPDLGRDLKRPQRALDGLRVMHSCVLGDQQAVVCSAQRPR